MKRKDEYQALLRELEQTPEALENTVQRAVKRRSALRKKRRLLGIPGRKPGGVLPGVCAAGESVSAVCPGMRQRPAAAGACKSGWRGPPVCQPPLKMNMCSQLGRAGQLTELPPRWNM